MGQIFQNKLDILINNARIAGEDVSSIEEKTPSGEDIVDMWEEIMMVNLVNLMRITGRCLPMMKECNHGAVITLSSLAATVSIRNKKEYTLAVRICINNYLSRDSKWPMVTKLTIMLVNGE
jgi:NADP-dependent 3-hydroxy acid dehydrogenase YdfG